MSEAHFTLIFRGPAVENGEIDVQDFAPALLSIGDLLQSANEVINGSAAKVAVKVRATAEGSFEVDLSLWQQLIESIFNYAKDHKDGIAAAQELADLVLKIGGGIGAAGTFVGGGLFALLKWLKGRKPEKIEYQDDGSVTIHIGDNYFMTNRRTVELAENVAVRNHAKRLVSTLQRDGITSIAARQNDRQELSLTREDIPSFDISDDQDEELADSTRPMVLQIISLSFKEENKWRLTDGGEPFTASIEDTEFLNKISNNEIYFGKNDCLICEVRERQVRNNKGLRKERTIIRVIEHKPSPRQLKLV
ncbi:hypothetical protein FV226_25745 [Methylobacterium sp. WL12]|uniref:hypothetical protein n=1 Tax=Methylobacterium sp. WL12 TaxID=2603890 RepID=UPI0011C83C40|nr:hypothetical protein [Methylobacterium sp. WL12]TXM64956.1 hypothetical protein FV226_25745 [Methylobacterium sp. WL12]